MTESRESSLATLLARGLVRVRQRAERTGTWKAQPGNQPQPDAADGRAADGNTAPSEADHQQGDQR
jgi:hypothetical protein